MKPSALIPALFCSLAIFGLAPPLQAVHVGAVATAFGVHAIVHAKRGRAPAPVVVGAMPVHFEAGVLGWHQHGLGVQLTF